MVIQLMDKLFKNLTKRRRAQVVGSKHVTGVAAYNTVEIGMGFVVGYPL